MSTNEKGPGGAAGPSAKPTGGVTSNTPNSSTNGHGGANSKPVRVTVQAWPLPEGDQARELAAMVQRITDGETIGAAEAGRITGLHRALFEWYKDGQPDDWRAYDPACIALVKEIMGADPDAQPVRAYPTYSPEEALRWPQPIPLVGGHGTDIILYSASLACMYSAPKSGKTFAAMDIALHVASGNEWHGYPVQQGKVVYIVAEGVSGIPLRLEAWKQKHGFLPDDIRFIKKPVQFWRGGDAAVETLVRELEAEDFIPILTIVDTYSRCTTGAKQNQDDDTGIIVSNLDKFRDLTGSTNLLLHHPPKSGDGPRGSSALPGALDTQIYLEKSKPLGIITLECDYHKDADVFEPIQGILEPSANSCVFVRSNIATPDKNGLSPVERLVLQAIADADSVGGVTSRQILDEHGKNPKSPNDKRPAQSSIFQAIGKLCDNIGAVERIGQKGKPGTKHVITDEGRKVLEKR